MTATRLALCTSLALVVPAAGAMTAAEHRVEAATAPHLALGAAGRCRDLHAVSDGRLHDHGGRRPMMADNPAMMSALPHTVSIVYRIC